MTITITARALVVAKVTSITTMTVVAKVTHGSDDSNEDIGSYGGDDLTTMTTQQLSTGLCVNGGGKKLELAHTDERRV